MPTSRRGYFI